MNRRSILASMCLLPLASCGESQSATLRYKVIAKAEVNGRPLESSSVMEITYRKISKSLLGNGGSTTLRGEALILDLGDQGTVYILPVKRPPKSSISQVYEAGILCTLGIKRGIGSLRDQEFDILRKASGRLQFQDYGFLPAFVAFGDETNPKTIYQVNPERIQDHFPGVRFLGLDIEITGEPITKRIRNRLTWLSTSNSAQVFDREPRGSKKPESETPIGHLIVKEYFFGDGSR